jgi:hypothetical protein
VVPWLLGDANTGKSTILSIVQAMYPDDLTAAITDAFEPRFGFSGIADAKCVISPDTPENIQNVISAASFQAMCTGDIMNMPCKYYTASSGIWRRPSIWASNQPGKWPDKAGAIYRRVMYFLFEKLVDKRDTTLRMRIIQNELSTIFIRCLLAYFDLIKEVGTHDIWIHAPVHMASVKEDLSIFTNPLEEFIRNGSDFYQIIFKPGAQTPMTQLEQAFSNFMKYGMHKKPNATIGRDYYPLTKHGYLVQAVSTCKICCKPVNMANCGDHFDRRNRTRRVMVINMEIVNPRLSLDYTAPTTSTPNSSSAFNGPAIIHQQDQMAREANRFQPY